MSQREEFYTIIDDEWAQFWASNHVTAPTIKAHFVDYIDGALGIVAKTSEDRFEKMIHKMYPHGDYYYHFGDMIRHIIVMFLENKIYGMTKYGVEDDVIEH